MEKHYEENPHSIIQCIQRFNSPQIESILRGAGYQVESVHTHQNLNEKLFKSTYDIMVTDDYDYSSHIFNLRDSAIPQSINHTKSLLLSNNPTRNNVKVFLNDGFDDVCRFPEVSTILLLRVQNLLRMVNSSEKGILMKGTLRLHFSKEELIVDNTKIFLNHFETIFLKHIILTDGYLNLEALQNLILKDCGKYFSMTNLRVKIHRLKIKVEKQSSAKPIRSRRGFGYYLSF